MKGFAKSEKISIEESARELRYKALKEAAEKLGANKIATGHNANDNTETILLNIIKGKSLSAIAGIPPKRGDIIRPILTLTRSEILEYLKERKLNYRTDSTNFENDFQRNFLRNKVIPLIKEKINPGLENTLLKTSFVLGTQSKLLEKITNNAFDNFVNIKNDSIEINLDFIESFGKETLPELVKKAFVEVLKKEVKFNELKSIGDLLDKQTGARLFLSEGVLVTRGRNKIIIEKTTDVETPAVNIKVGEKVNTWLGGLEISDSDAATAKKMLGKKNIEFIDAQGLDNEFLLRQWEQGDSFVPLGMQGEKKISDYLTDVKVPAHLKSKYLVLTNKGEIVWLVGLRINDKFKLTNKTRKVLKLCLN